jgi:hypothetical protein
MMTGVVTASREAVVRVRLRSLRGQEVDIDTVLDTGFTEALSLPQTWVDRLALPPGPQRASWSAYAHNARKTASGSLSITTRSVRAGPDGCRRPCSQSCTVRLFTPKW